MKLRSDEQRAAIFIRLRPQIALEIKDKIQAQANEKRSEAAKGNKNASKDPDKKNSRGSKCSTTEKKDPPSRTTDAMAEVCGVNSGAMKRQESLFESRPDLSAQVADGKIKPAEAMRQMKKDAIIVSTRSHHGSALKRRRSSAFLPKTAPPTG